MTGEGRLRILSRLVSTQDGPEVQAKRVCELSAEVTAMNGAGVMVMSDHGPQGSVCSSNAVSALIEELQYTFGQGPCVEAYDEGRPVLEPNLDQPAWPRWLAFTGPALDAGVRAVFGFPMRVGAVRLGALNLYRDRPGALSDEQHADALVLAPTGSSSAEANHSTSASSACETRSDRALPTTSPATSCETMSYRAMTSPW